MDRRSLKTFDLTLFCRRSLFRRIFQIGTGRISANSSTKAESEHRSGVLITRKVWRSAGSSPSPPKIGPKPDRRHQTVPHTAWAVPPKPQVQTPPVFGDRFI